MQLHESCHQAVWPLWQKIIFRFCFIFFGLFIMPFEWLSDLPLFSTLSNWYDTVLNAVVIFANDKLFHLKKVLIMPNGSGDTSFNYAELLLYTWLGIIGAIVWTALDRKRQNYARLNYLLCISIRYFLAFVALLYGIEKVMALQMPFPNTSQLASSLGDLLPMRFSWFFIGYSTPYQVFSGIMEVVVGLLLLFRRTATFGTMMAVVVFTNVMMLNLCYDIPVKLFSTRLVVLSIFLLAQEYQRIMAFFVMNKEAATCSIYIVRFPKRWMRISIIVLKVVFLLAVANMVVSTYGYYKDVHKSIVFTKPFHQGLFDITYTSKPAPEKMWTNMVFDNDKSGSIQTSDTALLSRRYGRSYFGYKVDTVLHRVAFTNRQGDSTYYRLTYQALPNGALALSGKVASDSVAMVLTLSQHRFQLAERQFHWLSEANR